MYNDKVLKAAIEIATAYAGSANCNPVKIPEVILQSYDKIMFIVDGREP